MAGLKYASVPSTIGRTRPHNTRNKPLCDVSAAPQPPVVSSFYSFRVKRHSFPSYTPFLSSNIFFFHLRVFLILSWRDLREPRKLMAMRLTLAYLSEKRHISANFLTYIENFLLVSYLCTNAYLSDYF